MPLHDAKPVFQKVGVEPSEIEVVCEVALDQFVQGTGAQQQLQILRLLGGVLQHLMFIFYCVRECATVTILPIKALRYLLPVNTNVNTSQ